MPRLSAIVIVKNEAENIAACLAGLAFCDERVVVDSGSSDDTVKIARESGARVESHAWEGFGPQKNFALSLATGDWILSVDADERVSAELAREIQSAIAAPRVDAYEIPRVTSFLGRDMRGSDGSSDFVLRLFRRDKARFSDDLVHERVICDGKVARLSIPLMHHSVTRLENALSRIDRYSSASAAMIVASGRRVSFMSGIWHGLWTFIRIYLLQRGFLDGREGFLQAVANAEGSYYRYMKAWHMSRLP
ncbi:MAG: glycosyltransferase family 2 protein [Xanthobacteraceae bacterium]